MSTRGQLELLLEWSLSDRGPALPSLPNRNIQIGRRVKEETASPLHHRVKEEPKFRRDAA